MLIMITSNGDIFLLTKYWVPWSPIQSLKSVIFFFNIRKNNMKCTIFFLQFLVKINMLWSSFHVFVLLLLIFLPRFDVLTAFTNLYKRIHDLPSPPSLFSRSLIHAGTVTQENYFLVAFGIYQEANMSAIPLRLTCQINVLSLNPNPILLWLVHLSFIIWFFNNFYS